MLVIADEKSSRVMTGRGICRRVHGKTASSRHRCSGPPPRLRLGCLPADRVFVPHNYSTQKPQYSRGPTPWETSTPSEFLATRV